MKRPFVLTLATLVLLLSACDPGISWNTENLDRNPFGVALGEAPGPTVPEPVPSVPAPGDDSGTDPGTPPISHPTDPSPQPPILTPPVTPLPPVVTDPDPYANCRVKDMPPRSRFLLLIKCPGEPARLVPRP